MARKTIGVFLAVGLGLAGLAWPAAAARMDFDQAGSGLDQVLSLLWEDAAAPGFAAAVPGAPVPPIVVTVSGMKMGEIGYGLELKHILKLWRWLFPGQPPDEALIRKRLAELKVKERRFAQQSQKPDNYLELGVAAAVKRSGLEAAVVNFPWSRDPKDSEEAIADFQKRLLALRDGAATQGRPLFIVAHSWGTILIHDALHGLERRGEAVPVQRLVTMGSPLVPHKLLVWMFRDICNISEHLQGSVSKPRNVRYWTNLWSDWDIYSNAVAAADRNLRVDSASLPYEARLNAMLVDPGTDHKSVRRDLGVLTDSLNWHESYWRGLRATLRTLGVSVDWNIMQENLDAVLPLSSPQAAR
ncbi:MAG: hypothetical protein WC881_05785 [Elusimicrobiota bacterium]|jgi:hypothetical protein